MRVAITGHRPDSFVQSHYTEGQVKMIVDGVVATFKREFGEDLSFNLGGAIGVDQWVARSCLDSGVKVHLYIPMLAEIQSRYWSPAQQQELNNQIAESQSIDISDPSGNYNVASYYIRDRKMVDNADIVVAFWVGKRKGGTYNTMKYALKKSKFVFNALDSLRPVFSDVLKSGWTPPIVEGGDYDGDSV